MGQYPFIRLHPLTVGRDNPPKFIVAAHAITRLGSLAMTAYPRSPRAEMRRPGG